MPSPVNPSQFDSVIPSASSDLCGKIKKVLLELPSLLSKFFDWFLASDGTVSDAAKAEIGSYLYQPGDLKCTLSSTITTGWLECLGQSVSRVTYAALFSSIGTTYGAGDNSTTFGLPDFRDFFMVGASATKLLGTTGGEEDVTLTEGQLPSHTHPIPGPVDTRFNTGSGAGGNLMGGSSTTGSTGGGESHENLPPYRPVRVLIKT